MTDAKSARMARRLRGLLKSEHPAELREQLRIWVAEFNRQARRRRPARPSGSRFRRGITA